MQFVSIVVFDWFRFYVEFSK